jgi:hypothetical protein
MVDTRTFMTQLSATCWKSIIFNSTIIAGAQARARARARYPNGSPFTIIDTDGDRRQLQRDD